MIHVMSRFQVNRLRKDPHHATQESGCEKEAAMNHFMIDNNDTISLVSGVTVPEGYEQFHSARQFENLSKDWPSTRFVQIWNQLPGMRPVKKFTDRKTAITRIWNAIQSLHSENMEPQARSPGSRLAAVREHTKAAQVIALLKQPAGCSLASLMKATGWQAHSVRGFLSGQLRKKLGLRVKSFRRDGERVYAIRS